MSSDLLDDIIRNTITE